MKLAPKAGISSLTWKPMPSVKKRRDAAGSLEVITTCWSRRGFETAGATAGERASKRSVSPGTLVASRGAGFCAMRGSITSSTRTPVTGSTARSERGIALDCDAEPRERRRDAAEIVGVVDADREREQRAARRLGEAELLAAVGRLEASRARLGRGRSRGRSRARLRRTERRS